MLVMKNKKIKIYGYYCMYMCKEKKIVKISWLLQTTKKIMNEKGRREE